MTVKVVSNFLAKKTSSKTSFTKHQVYLTITESHVKQSKNNRDLYYHYYTFNNQTPEPPAPRFLPAVAHYLS